jgi:2-oxoglutarate dehydrogenase E2 component (dihydrolipoamide succinyltransferase)
MATDITIPQLGESISEAVVSSWLKADGDYVERDEEIVELETDKVTMPLPAPAAGVLKHGAEEGDTVEVGSSLGSIDESAEKPAGDEKSKSKPKEEPAEANQTATAQKPAAKKQQAGAGGNGTDENRQQAPSATATEEPAEPPEPQREHAEPAEVHATALARKLAEQNDIDLHRVSPTGPGGRVREQDVLAFLQAQHAQRETGRSNGSPRPEGGPSAAPAPAKARETRTERMSQLRQRIASRLVEAQQTAAMLTTFNECDMTGVMHLRSRHKDTFLEKHDVKLGFMSFFAKAAVSALRTVPSVNAYITQTDKGPAVEYHDYCDIAFAVGTPKGLVVPVLRNVEALSFAQIESGLMDLAKRARDGKLSLDEMQGGTFTVSNGGVYGSMLSTPILNPPQSGILGMHNIIKRPVEHPEKPGEIALRPMMYLALSYDHRIVDGEGAVTFLKHIKECIESPERLLLEV